MSFQEMFQLYDYFMRMAENEGLDYTERKSYYRAARHIERQLADF